MAEITFVEDLVWQEVEDGMVVLHVAEGRYFELNAVAATILRVLHDTGNTKTALEHVVELYEVEMDDAESDLRALLDQFRQRNWIQ